MTLHQQDKEMRADSEFIMGELSFLVKGNKCRLLDGRRTPGYIETVFHDSGMFRWRITGFEDTGCYWDVPIEKVINYQFEKDSRTLDDNRVAEIEDSIKKFNKTLEILASPESKKDTEKKIDKAAEEAAEWLKKNSIFLRDDKYIDFNRKKGYVSLSKDLYNYLKEHNLEDMEEKTSYTMVTNPNSGEWMKGMSIVLAELGLVDYKQTIPRTKDIFTGIGSKENRSKYLIYRLAFLRALFNILGIQEVVLYRGMSSEGDWTSIDRIYLSATFDLKVAEAFSNLERVSKYRSSYIIKFTCPIEKLFMTYLETREYNGKYLESEATVLYDNSMRI